MNYTYVHKMSLILYFYIVKEIGLDHFKDGFDNLMRVTTVGELNDFYKEEQKVTAGTLDASDWDSINILRMALKDHLGLFTGDIVLDSKVLKVLTEDYGCLNKEFWLKIAKKTFLPPEIKPSAMMDKNIVLGEVDILTDAAAIARYVDIVTCEDKLQYSALANMLSNILNAAAKYNLGLMFSLYQSCGDTLRFVVYCENTNHYTRVIPLEGCKNYKAISVSVMLEPKLTIGNHE